jgi:hypothetical protein
LAPTPTSFGKRATRTSKRRLAELDSQRPLSGRVLIGEVGGFPAAAVSLIDGRVIADPFQPTATLAGLLRLRYQSLRALSETPSLRDRMRAALPTRLRTATSPTSA